ncbi:unnamed protein product [Rotaria socialis]|uniref:Cyclic nucleotide-binding domain-containing protein n=1 Tax=Rotaria socialis TaxID=392032 RepID=A0A819WB19_9BILA|nr:unnamed protein product [Rotaria socialis]CAF3527052.1 unnamed protein product [Rotaria socialis]CAF3686843.1 unnamed protein product [Rotaria socialis]CAF3715497.1 unnamed protein product [Rotaria socialis]CAF3744636.1 unnamed protein product [Rotaria socialis]
MALNYGTLIRAASKLPEQRTPTEINDFIVPWLKQSLKKKQGIFQKISDDVIYDICKTIMIERRPAWDVVIRQNDRGDTFYIILQGSVNIYRLDDDSPQAIPEDFDSVTEFTKLDAEPEKREELIIQTFGNYVVTLVGGFDFGERALITNEPRSATVMTTIATDLLVVDREVFSRTLKSAHEKELQEKTEFINRCPLFSSWSARLKRLVSLSLERGRFAYDSMLYKQGTYADAVYFIWSGEVKLSIDPLLHWLQYPHLLPQSDPMKQRAFELFLPMLQLTRPTDTVSRESFAIKRRYMTFAEAERERSHRNKQVALLNTGDIIGLESYVCDLNTHMNSARCTAPCDLFYILKHNFVRLQKRHGTQGLSERLREIVLLSLQAYPPRILHLPLINSLMKRQLASVTNDEQQQYHAKQSWLFHLHNATHSNVRRPGATSGHTSTTNSASTTRSLRARSLGKAAAIHYVTNDHIRVTKIEDRLKQWHAQMGDDSKTQIRSLTRFNVEGVTGSALSRSTPADTLESHSDGTGLSSSLSSEGNDVPAPVESRMEISVNMNDNLSTYPASTSSCSKTHLPQLRICTKQERYEDLRAYLKQAWKEFLKRPIPAVY